MGYERTVNSFHLDLLKEIGNIGAGHAATALSVLLDKQIDMKVPSVKIVSFDEMMEMAGGADNVVVSIFLRIEGDAPGSMFFILSLDQAEAFIQSMLRDDQFSFEDRNPSELGLSAMQELGNILSGSYLSSLADFTQLNLQPSVPSLTMDMAGAVISFGLIEISQVSDYAIVIDTAIKEVGAGSESVNGHFFLLPDPDSLHVIFQSLGVKG
ncbi:CheY-P-specific phosphatase CheC [[Bacillus] enclensis]|jgi:chemotaxis protein CheC|uniref:Chemotaxis protein CheC n=2 Tax=Rossellomorea TaxID=2837508 RepID=A0A0V8HJF1_9BACI|nr:chemotaxis protein CheC [[Bacillus] enclensis]QTC42429.1 chemotaxis protein CheC [Bacillus sp. V3]QWC24495.1 chemotaxis protein CheC [Bacillus haikouensis]KSU62536.1 CheY-P-specific phosphatase CheC [[Bacillus] enclensis]MBH9965458.1 chemotaxis protein CheC [[Bacillus] enclensis]SCC06023.1 chemotaxis protein CheC [[Bacillus] enclensis]